MGIVKYKKLSESDYNNITEKDEDTLYAVNQNGDFSEENLDTKADLYLGDKKISADVVQNTGTSENSVMSQKATTEAINGLQSDIDAKSEDFYGECNISPSTVDKTVTTLNGGFVLKKGAKVSVKFLQNHTASTMTLNVDGTGAKYVFRNGNSPESDMVKAYNVYDFVYDGTYWRIVGVDTDTTYSLATTSSQGLMSSADKVKLDGIDLSKYLPLTGGTVTGEFETQDDVHLCNKDGSKLQVLYGAKAKTSNSIAFGYRTESGLLTGDSTYPYQQIKEFNTLLFTIDDDSLYGVSLAKNDNTTYTYDNVDYTVTNTSTNSCSVFLIDDPANLAIKSGLGMAFCGDFKIYNGTIISAVNIVGSIWQILLSQNTSAILSYTEQTIFYCWYKTESSYVNGLNAISIGTSAISSGNGAVTIGGQALAASLNSFSFGYLSKSFGEGSIAIGNQAYSCSSNSLSLGSYAKVRGTASMALGSSSIVNASFSTTLGNANKIYGDYSSCVGYNNVANGGYSFVVGANSTANGNSSIVISRNGTANGDYSSVIGFKSITGIISNNSSLPYGKMSVIRPEQIVYDGNNVYGISVPKSDSVTFTFQGTEYTFTNPSSSYIHTIIVIKDTDNTFFKDGVSGRYECAYSTDTTVSVNCKVHSSIDLGNGYYIIAINQYDGTSSTYVNRPYVYMWQSTSSSYYRAAGAVNLGYSSLAAGDFSLTAGEQNVNSGRGSTCLGRINKNTSDNSFTTGISNINAGSMSFISGTNNFNNGLYSTVLGSNNRCLHQSGILIGTGLLSGTENQLVIGQYNEATNAAFIIGNGGGNTSRSNIMTVSKQGVVTANSFVGDLQGNAASADKVNNSLTIIDSVGTRTYNGSGTQTIDITALQDIGDIADLETSSKTDLVSAINEVNQKAMTGGGTVTDSTISPFAGYLPSGTTVIDSSTLSTNGDVLYDVANNRFVFRDKSDTIIKYYANWTNAYLYNDNYGTTDAIARKGKIFSQADKHWIVTDSGLIDVSFVVEQSKQYTDGKTEESKEYTDNEIVQCKQWTNAQITNRLNDKIRLVTELPESPEDGVLYLIPD